MALDNTKSLVQLRTIAVKTLAQVLNSEQTLDESLFEELTRNNAQTLPQFDRSWIYDVCSGVLRFRGRVDHIIDTYSLKKKPTGAVRRYLQTATFQLLAQDVPAALVVSETVQAIREHDGEIPAKFANAILRKVADQREQWQTWTVTEKSPFEEQLAWCSLPEWLFKKLRKERGSEWVFTFSKASLERPKIWYRELQAPKGYILENGYQGNEPKGYVQDISNQNLVEEILKLLKNSGLKAPKILDLCSAPGGKSLGMADAGYDVLATDIDEHRLQKVIENRTRLGFQDKIRVKPYLEVLNSDEKFDLIWVDAPCSSTGIIRRHPEIRWNRTPKDLERLHEAQKVLVDWAKTHLNPGGYLVYSTCSVLKEENSPDLGQLQVIQTHETFPQQEPFGDAILSLVAQSS